MNFWCWEKTWLVAFTWRPWTVRRFTKQLDRAALGLEWACLGRSTWTPEISKNYHLKYENSFACRWSHSLLITLEPFLSNLFTTKRKLELQISLEISLYVFHVLIFNFSWNTVIFITLTLHFHYTNQVLRYHFINDRKLI